MKRPMHAQKKTKEKIEAQNFEAGHEGESNR